MTAAMGEIRSVERCMLVQHTRGLRRKAGRTDGIFVLELDSLWYVFQKVLVDCDIETRKPRLARHTADTARLRRRLKVAQETL